MRFLPDHTGLPNHKRLSTHSLALGLLLALLPLTARPATEGELRAAMIYNIARFVQWPHAALAGKQFDLCTVATIRLIDGLSVLQGKPLSDLPVAVQAVKRDADLAGCRVHLHRPGRRGAARRHLELLARTHSAA